jgi:hypothetical protein
MQRTIVLIHQRFVHNDETFRTVQIGKVDCVCLPHATEIMNAINSASTHEVTAELAYPLYLHNKAILVPASALEMLIHNLCRTGVIDRDSLPEAERERFTATENRVRNNGQRKPMLHVNENEPSHF